MDVLIEDMGSDYFVLLEKLTANHDSWQINSANPHVEINREPHYRFTLPQGVNLVIVAIPL